MIHIREKVVSLIPGLMCNVNSQAQSHRAMPRVTSAFICLCKHAVCSCFQARLMSFPHQVAPKLRQSVCIERICCPWESAHLVVFDERDTLIIDIHIVAEHSDTDASQGIAEPPVRPIMSRCLPPSARICPCAVSSTQEIHYSRIPHIQHPLLELSEVCAAPSFVVAHQLRSLCELIAIESVCEALVGIAGNILGGVRPSHQHLNSMVCTGCVAFDFPSERILISDGSSTCCVHIILS